MSLPLMRKRRLRDAGASSDPDDFDAVAADPAGDRAVAHAEYLRGLAVRARAGEDIAQHFYRVSALLRCEIRKEILASAAAIAPPVRP